MPILMPIWLQAINENAELVKQGLEPTNINTFETFFSGWLGVGAWCRWSRGNLAFSDYCYFLQNLLV